MDERFRQIERTYRSQPTTENLVQLLREYARIGRIPEGDILALEAINGGPEGPDPNWYREFNMDLIQNLLEAGYPIGAYFNVKVIQRRVTDLPKNLVKFPSVEMVAVVIAKEIGQQADRMARRILSPTHWLDKLDDYCLDNTSSEARQTMEDERPTWQHDEETVAKALRNVPSDLYATIVNLSSVITPARKSGKQTVADYRIFVPVTELERLSWPVTIGAVGFSRQTRREYGSSMIDWGIPNQVNKLRKEFLGFLPEWIIRLDDGNESIRCTTSKFGANLLLALSGYIKFRKKSWL